MKPMRMTDVPFETANEYITNPDWVLEQKLDGARVMVIAEGQEDGTHSFKWLASGGGPLKFSAAVQHLEEIENQLRNVLGNLSSEYAVLDGELLIEEGLYYLFDSPELRIAGDLFIEPTRAYVDRRETLAELIEDLVDRYAPNVKFARTAESEQEKLQMWQQILEANVEGGMAKRRDAVYEFGTRTKSMVKLKLVKSADVVVTSVDRTFKADGVTLSHGKAELAVPITPSDDPQPWVNSKGKRASLAEVQSLKPGSARRNDFSLQPRSELPVGNASLIGKDLTIDIGSVVEVNYLYFQEAMIQPRIVRKRLAEEKLPEDCTMAQFPEYSRERV